MNPNKPENEKAREEFQAALLEALSAFHLGALGDEQLAQLVEHYAMMREWNRHSNLTRIVAPFEAARLHYAESLFGARWLGAARAVLDIGSGAGFPGLPLAVACPGVEVTALEANQKKALFLYEAKDALQLQNFKVARARLEDFDCRRFDWLCSRALDRADAVMPRVLNHLGERQHLMLYCAPDMVEHLKQKAAIGYRLETHRLPFAATRLVAIFSRS
ncbi:MAG: 16S rRNA (guanine(527)-N(7))-methyltransferase RsmG [Acidobacteria bacterium]|nr:16S rRNA (guanine(527)-N(7))-methyltransferase RsmG [Acidobacteriota bacterium]